MRKRIYQLCYVCFLTLVLPSCDGVSRAPIDRDKMTAILYDMNLAETWSTFSSGANMTQAKNTDSLAIYNITILKHHDVTLEEFQKSMEWYKMHTDEIDSIYVRLAKIYAKQQSAENNRRK